MRDFNRRPRLVIRVCAAWLASVMTAALMLAFGAGIASAKTTTLHIFEDFSLVFYQANGQPMTSLAFDPGDYFIETDLDYVGNHKKHAKTWSASGNLVCTFTSSSLEAVCDSELAVGGSLLLSDYVMVNFAATPIVVAINGGTGNFKNAKGISTRTCVRSCNAIALFRVCGPAVHEGRGSRGGGGTPLRGARRSGASETQRWRAVHLELVDIAGPFVRGAVLSHRAVVVSVHFGSAARRRL